MWSFESWYVQLDADGCVDAQSKLDPLGQASPAPLHVGVPLSIKDVEVDDHFIPAYTIDPVHVPGPAVTVTV
jgi:hypothetical protein